MQKNRRFLVITNIKCLHTDALTNEQGMLQWHPAVVLSEQELSYFSGWKGVKKLGHSKMRVIRLATKHFDM